MQSNALNFHYLADHPEYLDMLSEWMLVEWGQAYPQASLEQARQRVLDHCNKGHLPLTILACQGKELIGVVSLRAYEFPHRADVTPWLCGLGVKESYRNRGIGTHLIQEAKKLARSLGYCRLYLLVYNTTLQSWYERLGWRLFDKEERDGLSFIIMETSLKEESEQQPC